MQLIDLSREIYHKMPRIPTHPPIIITPFGTHQEIREADGYKFSSATLFLAMGDHAGTHVDAPVHFIKGTWSADEIPDDTLVAPVAVIHVHERAQTNPDTMVTVDDLKGWERRHGRIPAGAAVFMHSGWEARVNDQAAFRNADAQNVMHFPGFGREAAEFLLDYMVEDGKGHLVVPYSLTTNDGKYMVGIGNADQWFTLLKDSFDMLYREGKEQPRMMSVGMHMRVIGHPGRAVGLERLLDGVLVELGEQPVHRVAVDGLVGLEVTVAGRVRHVLHTDNNLHVVPLS